MANAEYWKCAVDALCKTKSEYAIVPMQMSTAVISSIACQGKEGPFSNWDVFVFVFVFV